MMTPGYLRAEVVGPLGMRVGLIQINADWIYFYDTRAKTAHRLPFVEFVRDSARRDRFFNVLPVPIPGPFFLDLALSRSGLESQESEKSLRSCEYLPEENIYRLLFVSRSEFEARHRWHRVDIDPTAFYPLRHLTRLSAVSELLETSEAHWVRTEWDFRYSRRVGEGLSTLPRLLRVFRGDQELWSFEWISAEPIPDRGPEIFQWRPTALMTVQDY
jgi:hypothetical protein